MIKNEDTYCTVQHKIVRELTAWEAVVYGTIVSLLRKTGGYGNVSNDTLIDLIGRDKKSIYRWIDNLIKAGYLEKVGGKGRGNISIYYVTKKGGNITPFKEEKRGQIDTEKGANMTEKRGCMPPINKGINKEINKENSLSSEEDKIFIEKENINNPEELERQAIEDVKNLFAKSDDEKAREESVKEGFEEFWNLFNPEEQQRKKYKVAQNYWVNEMEEYRRAACLKVLRRGNKPGEKNPFFFLQHFSPVRFFITKERDQYKHWKDGVQLCRVRWNDEQRIIAAYWADVFELEILDDHYEKRFEI